MKTLYVTDLDGTLLNKDGHISDTSAQLLNNAINNGALVTLATGRCLESSLFVAQSINMQLPWVINNGAFVYCPQQSKRITSHLLPTDATHDILHFCQDEPYRAQLYTLDEKNDACFYYSETYNTSLKQQIDFYQQNSIRKVFQGQHHHSKALMESIISVELRHEKEPLLKLKHYVENTLGLQTYFYPCYFADENYLLEIHNPHASKGNAVTLLKELLEVDRIVCFGDELNDTSMMKIADHGCAVENANEVLKSLANEIIATNNEDSVAKYIAQDFKKS